MFINRRWVICGVLLSAMLSPLAEAAPRLSAVFGDQMVLQHGRPLAIWGWAQPGEKLHVELEAG